LRRAAPWDDARGVAWWYVYVARCRDDTLYCGIARDVAARIAEHDAGTGARYTRGRGPLTVVLVRRCRDQGGALRLEHAIKQLPRAAKQALLAEPTRLAAIVRRVARARRTRGET
jgi:putative endonuclease